MTRDFWRGRKVLVTGHTGFKGAWLSLWLQRLGADVTGLALPPEGKSLFNVAGVGAGMSSRYADVRDLDSVVRVLQESQPEVVIHMAAQAIVRRSFEDPVGTYATNVMGTVNVLEAIRRTSSVAAAVIVTSDKCYENREWIWGYRENDPMGGYDPYSNSKGCAELVTSAYRGSFFSGSERNVAVASARAGNVIGGGDWARDRLIPDIMSCWIAGRPVKIRRPDAIRPWQHVLDPLRGYLTLAERCAADDRSAAGAWNFGPSEEGTKTVAAVTDELMEMWGPGAKWDRDEQPGAHEATLLRLDISKARWQLGWQPRLGLREALRLTVDWYRQFAGGGDMRLFTEKQIADYEAMV